MLTHHFPHRFNEEALSGKGMQPFHVDQQVPILKSQRLAFLQLRCFVVKRKRRRNRRIDDMTLGAPETQFSRAEQQPIAVERHGGGGAIGAGKEIRAESLWPVVPDFGSVECEDE
jgi:hypothetical protein